MPPRSCATQSKKLQIRDEVLRYGLHQKTIQNPYRHQKTALFKAQQAAIRNDTKIPVSLDIKGLRGNRRQQPPTSKNRLYRVGKDAVGGSNPPSSSKKSCFREKTGLFLYFLTNLICGSRCGTVLTHTVTHTRKCAERAKKERKGSSAIYQMAFATFNAQYAYSFIF